MKKARRLSGVAYIMTRGTFSLIGTLEMSGEVLVATILRRLLKSHGQRPEILLRTVPTDK